VTVLSSERHPDFSNTVRDLDNRPQAVIINLGDLESSLGDYQYYWMVLVPAARED
jgi:hypothetical protein